ncbi:MAG TPA: rRNA maturation RNase YbeY [Vicinamibacterales bacterium]|nr:rRNA maturation RNase YbeY [Vicinamibacterales bacterium]
MDPDSSRASAAKRRRGAAAHDGGRIRISVTDGRGSSASAPGLAAWLQRVAPRHAPPELTIALVSDARIRALNRKFRRRNAVTDVLSFEPSDLAIATGRARAQARDAGHAYADELKVLALHGLLHLIGYDHDDPADRGRMDRLERRLRAKGGLRESLIERAARARPGQRARRRPTPAR